MNFHPFPGAVWQLPSTQPAKQAAQPWSLSEEEEEAAGSIGQMADTSLGHIMTPGPRTQPPIPWNTPVNENSREGRPV